MNSLFLSAPARCFRGLKKVYFCEAIFLLVDSKLDKQLMRYRYRVIYGYVTEFETLILSFDNRILFKDNADNMSRT